MSIAHSLKLPDIITICAVVATATWFLADQQADLTRAVNQLSQNVEIMSMRLDQQENVTQNLMSKDKMALWIERARQAPDLASLPSIPLNAD